MIDSLTMHLTDQAALDAAAAHEEVEIFVSNDPYGLLMSMLGMGIVFLVLFLIFMVFSFTPKLYTTEFKQWWFGLWPGKKKDIFNQKVADDRESKPSDLSGEVNAAIAAAIHLYRSELHDYESTVLTISKVSKTYSPWSSKLYGLRNLPRK